MSESSGQYIVLISLHGLIRGENLELGRDSDTGGQTKYVVELARALAESPDVDRVDLMTRLVDDAKVADEYAAEHESIADKAQIVRVPFGPKRYLRKEQLWPWMGYFIDGALQRFRKLGRTPDIIHAHYADAGYVGADLASLLGCPLVFTGHSLGAEKKRRLLDGGMKPETIESRFNIARRIDAEEKALSNAALVVASTNQEADDQYAQYDNYRKTRVAVIPPGVDLSRFRPPRRTERRPPIYQRIARFLEHPQRPWILALSRPDERKNIRSLIDAYASSDKLKETANLVVVAGSREDIREMDRGPREVLTDLLLRIDRHNLYGKVAYPKRHEPEEAPDIYRLAAKSGGVFVNPALTEPFGLTLLEAAASGLPVLATDDGGPRDILARSKNGLLIDPLDIEGMAKALEDALANRGRLKRWSAAGLRAVERYYSWQGHAKLYLREVKKVLGRPQRRKQPIRKTNLPSVDRILFSDIDDTLLGDPKALKALVERLNDTRERCAFAIATGRRIDSAVDVLKEWGAPTPEVYVTAVGTEIHYRTQLTPDKEWSRNIEYRWDSKQIADALKDSPGLELQPKSEQRRHKVSFYIDPRIAPEIKDIEKRLRKRGLRVKVIFSHGQFLDVLPVRASKGLAIRYVADRWGVPMERVLVAGDSGNDEEMLTGRSLAVVVSNYSEELERLRGMTGVYFASKPYSWGILEGIDHYEFLGHIRDIEEDEPAARPTAD